MVSVSFITSFVNTIRERFSEAWKNLFDRVCLKVWKYKNFSVLASEFQEKLFLLDENGEECLEKENKIEKLPAIFNSIKRLTTENWEEEIGNLIKRNIKEVTEEAIDFLCSSGGDNNKYPPYSKFNEFLKKVLQAAQRPITEYTEEMLQLLGGKYLKDLIKESTYQKREEVIERINKFIQENIHKDFFEKVVKCIRYLKSGWMTCLPADVQEIKEDKIEITGLKEVDIIRKLIEKAIEEKIGENNKILVPIRVEKQKDKEYLIYKIINIPPTAVHNLFLIPSKKILKELLKACDFCVLWTLWLTPVSKKEFYNILPYGPVYETRHWFEKIKDIPVDKQVTVQEAINKALGAIVFRDDIKTGYTRTLTEYYIPSNVPLIFMRMPKNAMEKIINLYKSHSDIEIQETELKIKPAKISFEVKKDKETEKIIRKVEEGSEFSPEFVMDPSLNEKKLKIYKITFKNLNEHFFILRFTGKGSIDTIYIGFLPIEREEAK